MLCKSRTSADVANHRNGDVRPSQIAILRGNHALTSSGARRFDDGAGQLRYGGNVELFCFTGLSPYTGDFTGEGSFVQASGSTNEHQFRAIHVRCGEDGLAARVDRWLSANQVVTSDASDPYHACVALAEKSAVEADLVFVGLDWLTDDELSLLNFVRDTWKNCVVVAYSDDRSRQILLRDPLTYVCREPAQLVAILAGSAADLVQRVRSAAGTTVSQSRSRPSDRPALTPASAPPALPKVLDLPVTREYRASVDSPRPDNFVHSEPKLEGSEKSYVQSAENSSDLVSREELTALLNTYFR